MFSCPAEVAATSANLLQAEQAATAAEAAAFEAEAAMRLAEEEARVAKADENAALAEERRALQLVSSNNIAKCPLILNGGGESILGFM